MLHGDTKQAEVPKIKEAPKPMVTKKTPEVKKETKTKNQDVPTDIAKLKCALAIEVARMADGKLRTAIELNDFSKNALKELMQRHHFHRMRIDTEVCDKWKEGKVHMLLMNDEVYGDAMDDNEIERREASSIGLCKRGNSDAAIMFIIPENGDPATVVYYEDIDPWGFGNLNDVINAIIQIVDHYVKQSKLENKMGG